jgi:hypothetical protein
VAAKQTSTSNVVLITYIVLFTHLKPTFSGSTISCNICP